MSLLSELEEKVDLLSPEDFTKFRKFVADRDFEKWDEQIEADSKAGKFDALVARARKEHAEGKTRPI